MLDIKGTHGHQDLATKNEKKKTYLSHCFKSKWQYKAWLISIYNTYKLILFVKQTFFFVINLINNGNINYFNKIIKVLGKRDQAHHQNYTVSNKLIKKNFKLILISDINLGTSWLDSDSVKKII